MKRMLLFIDDNTSLLHLLSRSFSEYFEVKGFHSSEDAMQYIENNFNNLDIILSDYKMPDYNGIQLLQKAKDLNSSTVRILFTGYADLDDVRSGTEVYDALINKNLLKETAEIIKVINQVGEKNVRYIK